MSDRDANTPPTSDELRQLQRQRAADLMPEWARARKDGPVSDEIKAAMAALQQKLFKGEK